MLLNKSTDTVFKKHLQEHITEKLGSLLAFVKTNIAKKQHSKLH